MDEKKLRTLLQDLENGRVDMDSVIRELRSLPYEDLGFAKIDHHRELRTGFPEVVFCQGKTSLQVAEILARLSARHSKVMATRASPEVYDKVRELVPDAWYHALARIITVGWPEGSSVPLPSDQSGSSGNQSGSSIDRCGPSGDRIGASSNQSGCSVDGGAPPRETLPDAGGPEAGDILVIAAGTSDLPVAEEAAVTALFLGNRVGRLYDVGVSGLHRLLDNFELMRSARVLIVVAGMEGALPSVVAGMVGKPLIGVPTSIGYGANFGGLAPLLTMLNSCAPGIGVVNIDNGFGAARLAHLINHLKAADS